MRFTRLCAASRATSVFRQSNLGFSNVRTFFRIREDQGIKMQPWSGNFGMSSQTLTIDNRRKDLAMNNGILMVTSGNIRSGQWRVDGTKLRSDSGLLDLKNLITFQVISTQRESKASGTSMAKGGLLGFVLLGPAGALAGAMAGGGKKQTNIAIVSGSFRDGKYFSASTTVEIAAELQALTYSNSISKDLPPSPNYEKININRKDRSIDESEIYLRNLSQESEVTSPEFKKLLPVLHKTSIN